MGTIRQQTSNDMDVHLMTIPADCITAIYIPTTINEIIHITFIPLAISYDILDIKFSRLRINSSLFILSRITSFYN